MSPAQPATHGTPTPAGGPSAGASHELSAHEALRLSAAVLYEAERRARPHEMVTALAHMARCYRGIDAPGAARGMLLEALRWAGALGGVDTEADLTCELAETTCAQAELNESLQPGSGQAERELARDHAFDALRLVPRVADRGWESRLLLRLADVLDRCGDHADAARLQGMAVQRMEAGIAGEPSIELPAASDTDAACELGEALEDLLDRLNA
jgi:hypothetical protein